MADLKRVRTVAGDYALGDLAERMSSGFVLDDALTEYCKHLDGQSAIAFCTTIEHSLAVARFFQAAGIRARHLDGDTPTTERRALIAALATGEVQVLMNCSLISEGLDVPSVAGAILLRPTKSLALHLQQIGRALRPAPGKTRAIILDHAGNTLKHGLPDLEHPWSLDGRPKQKGEALAIRGSGWVPGFLGSGRRSVPHSGHSRALIGITAPQSGQRRTEQADIAQMEIAMAAPNASAFAA
jgi:superfamily II DNA or RNA helicase